VAATISVPGSAVSEPADQLVGQYVDTADVGIAIEVRAAVTDVEAAARSGEAPQHLEGEDSDVVEIIDGDGVVDYFTVAQLRSLAAGRGAESAGIIDLTAALMTPDMPLRGGSAELRSVRVLGRAFPPDVVEQLDLVEKLKGAVVDAATELAARNAARWLVRYIERPIDDNDPDFAKRRRRPKRHGVYRIDRLMTMSPAHRVEGELPSSDEPYLCLIHGTASHTENGFSGLLGTDEWARLIERYGDRIVALEHPTLSVSPAVNAAALADAVPANSTLHLVSHSRGGLVGDLFSIAAASGARGGLDVDRLRSLRGEEAEGELEAFAELGEVLSQKTIRVARFVRAGAPASGTLLASGRLDTWAKYSMNIVGLIPGLQGTPWQAIVKSLVLTFLDQRTDTDVIPGLEAQMPESPFIHFVNTAQPELEDGLGVIAHDVQGKGWVGRPKVWLADRFYGEDHDLVVDTRSMYQGAPRVQAHLSFHKGAENDHFKYFSGRDPRVRLTDWLLSEDNEVPIGFEEVDRSAEELEEPPANRSLEEGAPIALIVPAFMGSTLTGVNGVVWPSVPALGHGLGAIGPSEPLSASGLTPAYGDLAGMLGGRFDVKLFPYDWRQSLEAAADELEQRIQKFLQQRTVHIVAHSSGCLVTLLAMAKYPELLTSIRRRDGRLLLLGPLRGGTVTALQHASGTSRLADALRLVDPTKTNSQVARHLQGYASLLEMLPVDGEHWHSAWWAGSGLGVGPDQDRLDSAKRVADKATLPDDTAGLFIVSGSNSPTPLTLDATGSGKVPFSGSLAGDGVVAHASLRDARAATYFADCDHRGLLSAAAALTSYVDILASGKTGSLPTGEPEVSADPMPITAARALFPTADDLVDSALGGVKGEHPRDERPVLRVEVAHGDLTSADHPVMIGQFEGTSLFGAAWALDCELDHLLERRHGVGAYPGPIGTHLTVLRGDKGGVVIGLGEIGDLTSHDLSRSVTEGAVDYALRQLERQGAPSDGGPLGIELSPLLIGSSGDSGLGIPTSVDSILRGVVRANRILADRDLSHLVRIEQVQFIERHEDLAVEAARAVMAAKDTWATEPDTAVVVNQQMRVLEGGLPGQPDASYREGEWRRLVIESVRQPTARSAGGEFGTVGAGDMAKADSGTVGLVFTSVGKRARAERELDWAQRKLIDDAVDDAINSPGGNGQVQNTLYQLLLPNHLRGEEQSGENLLLVLDPDAADYPWEMLSTRSSRLGDQGLTPLGTEVGLLRRLSTEQYRLRPKSAAGSRALVIGDPPAGSLPQLPHAREEAQIVAATFETHGYQVERIITSDGSPPPSPLDILNGLFRADYRIIHVAAHGKFDPDNPAQSGIYIGEDTYLTATEFERLAVTPDLVFLNCCHLGRVRGGSGQEAAGAIGNFHRLAASLSQQLIRDGVRTVVAAGWAVNDAAAGEFARRFYTEMLAGVTLGVAARTTRAYVYKKYSEANTWGAYQIYGDPGFTLPRVPGARHSEDTPEPFVARRQLLVGMYSLLQRARAHDADAGEVEEALDKVLARGKPEWLEGEVAYLSGEVYRAVGRRALAVKRYGDAINSWGGDVNLTAVERYANEAMRLAKDHADEGRVEEAESLVDDAGARLKNLVSLSPTPERLALYGAHYMRLIQLSPESPFVPKWIKEAHSRYAAASDLYYQRTGTVDYYSLLNAVQFAWLKHRKAQSLPPALEKQLTVDLDAVEAAAEVADRQKSTYWTRVAPADVALARALVRSTLEDDTVEIVSRYREVFNTGSTGDTDSTINHVRFLRDALQDTNPTVAEQLSLISAKLS
jgi:pimeloyl-ACP methyl ester carboxylesterase